MNPTLTISIATLNRSLLLKELLDGILKSDESLGEKVEIDVIVDSESDFETNSLLRSYNSPFLRFFVVPNGGLSNARNFGARMARGRFIRLQDDDDLLPPHSILEMLQSHAQSPDSIFLGKTILHNNADNFMNFAVEKSGFLFNYNSIQKKGKLTFEDFWGGRVSLPTKFLLEQQFDSNLRFGAEDIEWAYRFSSLHDLKLSYNPKILSVMNRNMSAGDVLRRSISQGWSNSYIQKKYAGTPLANWALENSGALLNFTLEESILEKEFLKQNLILDETSFENLYSFVSAGKLQKILSFQEALWWRFINLSKSIGYHGYLSGHSQQEIMSMVIS
jgi:glycosyltransferase involved in cell wall biosynthesis